MMSCHLTTYDIMPYGEGGSNSLPGTPQRLQNQNWPPGDSKMADGSVKGSISMLLDAINTF